MSKEKVISTKPEINMSGWARLDNAPDDSFRVVFVAEFEGKSIEELGEYIQEIEQTISYYGWNVDRQTFKQAG